MLGRIIQLWGVLRRFYLVHCRKDYVRKQLEKRGGECRGCGECCLFVVRCPWLDESRRCKHYDRRPLQCQMFPIDERDLSEVSDCGFEFVESSDDGLDSPGRARTDEI
ncbi:MAG: YkgJ family cysteine cluster protein [Planctomycetota bacterium]